MSPKALVTGGNGFVGSHLVEELLKKGYQVTCLVRASSDLTFLSGLNVEFRYGDITDAGSLKEALKGIDFVFHVAGITRAKNKEEFFRVNAGGTRNLVQTCFETNPGVRKSVYVSSQTAAGPAKDLNSIDENVRCRPIDDYGRSKLAGEQEVLKFKDKIPITIIRPPAVYGPRDKDTLYFFQTINKGIIPSFGLRESYLSLIYVKDLVRGLILAAESQKSSGQIYFLTDGKTHSWSEALDTIKKHLEVKAVRLRVPCPVLFGAAFFAEVFSRLLGKTPLLHMGKAKDLCQRFWISDSAKAKTELGFIPEYDFEKGALETVQWYKENKWL
ncbi:MAG TPA: NAD-dependent epimerase/dehydratase family protein [Terriglobales bacterium]|nr:NAD-dependent epimerase/dehydratase family protein [Terriglobales bacterium]